MLTTADGAGNDDVMRRWILHCTLAEAIGIAAVALAYALVDRGMAPAPAILAGGAIEGFALGLAQAIILRRAGICPGCWVTMTMAAAILGYGVSLLAAPETDQGAEPPLVVTLGLAAGLGAAMGAVIGALQALPGRVALHPTTWIWRNTIGWAAAMPCVFLAATSVSQATPLPVIAIVGLLGGAVAGAIVAFVTAPALPLALRDTAH